MGRGDIMRSGRRRPLWGYIVFGAVIFLLIYLAQRGIFRRQEIAAGVNIPVVGDAVQRAYEGLPPAFRSRIQRADFATMFHRMSGPESGGALPEIEHATAPEPLDPDRPLARFRVQYPTAKGKSRAEYVFVRIDGLWQVQSYTLLPVPMPAVEPDPDVGKPSQGPPAPAPKGAARETKATPPPEATPTPTSTARPKTPCDYIIQPGDTLTAISLHFYGTTRYWRRILEANPGLSERNLRPGRRIRIPSSPEPATPKEEPETGSSSAATAP